MTLFLRSSPKLEARPPPQRLLTYIPWYIILPLTLFVVFAYGIGIALYLRSPVAVEQQSFFYEPALGIPQQPPYFQLTFSDLSHEHLFFTMRWAFFRNLILTYDWTEFHYNATIVGLHGGAEFPIRRVSARRTVFEFEGSTTTEFAGFSISGVPYDEIVVSIAFHHCVRALVGVQFHVTFARCETVYWLRPMQTVVEVGVALALCLLLRDFASAVAGLHVWSFVLVVLVVLSIDPILLSLWAAPEPVLLVTQQAVGRLLRQFFRGYLLLRLAFFTSHDMHMPDAAVFWFLFFAVFCGYVDYRGAFDALEAVQASQAVELPWAYGEIFVAVGDVCFAGCAFSYVAGVFQQRCLDACRRAFWAAVATGAAAHGLLSALMAVNRDFVPFAGGMAASVMYGAVAAAVVVAGGSTHPPGW